MKIHDGKSLCAIRIERVKRVAPRYFLIDVFRVKFNSESIVEENEIPEFRFEL